MEKILWDTLIRCPSRGRNAGRLLNRSFVCSVLKSVSKFPFSSARGGFSCRR